MNDSILGTKLKVIDDYEHAFHKRLTDFTGEVKTKMQNTTKELANQCFELALVFLSQAFPNLENLESASAESQEKTFNINAKFKDIERKLEAHEKNVSFMFQDYNGKALEDQTDLAERLKDNYVELKGDLAQLKTKLDQFDRVLKDQARDVEKKQEQFDKLIDNVKNNAEKQKQVDGQLKDCVTNVARKQEHFAKQLEDQETNVLKKQEELDELYVHVTNYAKRQEQFDNQVQDRLTELSDKLQGCSEEVKENNNNMRRLEVVTESNAKDIAGLMKQQRLSTSKLEEPETPVAVQQMSSNTASTSAAANQSSASAAAANQNSASTAAVPSSGNPLRKIGEKKNKGSPFKRLSTLFSAQQSQTTTTSEMISITTASTSAVATQRSASAVTANQSSASALTANQSSASAEAVQSSENTLRLSQRGTFQIQDPSYYCSPYIVDAKLLSSNLLLVADCSNSSVQLFNDMGQTLDHLYFDWQPFHLALLDGQSQSCSNVALSFQSSYIALLEINQYSLGKKSIIKTKQHCLSLASVDSRTLAVGYKGSVDLIDLSGTVLRTFWCGVAPNCMVASWDKRLILLGGMVNPMLKNAANRSTQFVKLNLQQGTQDRRCEVPLLESPMSIASLKNGSYVVVNQKSPSLHLVGADGTVEKRLGKHTHDFLSCTTVQEKTCVCCSFTGSVFVFDIEFK